MIQNPTMPVQSSPVQPCSIQAPPEFNAIKINIQGAQVGAPTQYTYPAPTPDVIPTPPAPPEAGQSVDVQA